MDINLPFIRTNGTPEQRVHRALAYAIGINQISQFDFGEIINTLTDLANVVWDSPEHYTGHLSLEYVQLVGAENILTDMSRIAICTTAFNRLSEVIPVDDDVGQRTLVAHQQSLRTAIAFPVDKFGDYLNEVINLCHRYNLAFTAH